MKIRFLQWRLASVLAIALGLCAVRAEELSRQSHFTVILPEGFSILKESPVEDFDLYTISKDGRAYVRMYLGNHPAYPKRSALPDSDVVEFEFGKVQVTSEWRSGVLAGREWRLGISENEGWPSVLHVWTVVDAPGEVAVADRIVSSLREIVETRQ
jgi:hypothetical protein